MKILLLLCAFLTFGTLPASAQTAPAKVGLTNRMFTDETRLNWEGTAKRPLTTTIWYPAEPTATEKPVVIGNPARPLFLAGSAAQDAKFPAGAKRFPLIVLSHGTGGSALQMMWLGQTLAAHGFIVACPNHHGNTGAEEKPTAQGFLFWWERAKDLHVLLDKVLADPEIGPHVDRNRIGAAGFSLGGATVISVAGGLIDLKAFETFCQSPEHDATCDPQPEFPDAVKELERMKQDPAVAAARQQAGASYRDSRIKAVFALAPAVVNAYPAAGLKAIKIPLAIVVGDGDATTPPATNAIRLAQHIKQAKLTVLPGKVEHYTFLSECSPFGQTVLPYCRDAEGVDRAEIHRTVSQMAVTFFQRALSVR
ncbi:MAG: dienelactone hydrolase family protein [Blastocatellia bacterium]|nr:dienelactone hydrolase family protein [Blastocatellia bacterium]